MKSVTRMAVAAAAALFIQDTSAATSSYCPSGPKDLCFKWGIPEASASSNSGNIYFRIEAPSTYQWVGLGIGTGMRNAQMFLVYQDGSGNVTLSTRTASGHSMPQYSERSGVELIEGSGVIGSKIVANIKCSDCSSLKFDGSNDWIAAWREGDSLASSSRSAIIQEHDDNAKFAVNFSQASISSDSNPFIESSGSGNTTESDSSSNSGNSNSGSSGGSGGSAVTEKKEDDDDDETLIYAHGIIMSIVFLIGYPIGAVLMPLIGSWIIHAAWQMLAFLGMWAGFGIGYVIAKKGDYWWTDKHVRLGTIVVVLLVIQPILGFLHHRQYVKHQKRGVVSHAHIWYGRILMILGIINGGLGLQLSGGPKSFIIAYSVIAGIVSVIYVAGTLLRRPKKTQGEKISSPQMP